MTLRTPTSTLFPYTTLFRSEQQQQLRSSLLPDAYFDSLRYYKGVYKIYDDRIDPFCHRDVQSKATGFRSEEHTSELQSHVNLVCRLLLEKKKKKKDKILQDH